MKDYDRMGREAWRGFLSSHGVAQLRAPLDTSEARTAMTGGSR
jgi:hypothetical protein